MSWDRLSRGPRVTQQQITEAGKAPGMFTVGRVTSISYDEQSSQQGWNGLGTITYDEVTPIRYFIKKGLRARPLDPNLKRYPLVNELVYILNLPGPGLNGNSTSYQQYYINTINIWNHPHHNGFPEDPNDLPPEQQKDYDTTVAGSPRRVLDEGTEINLGNTFIERPNIHPLLPFEGDVILEGRWGNSLRFGSTVLDPSGSEFIFPPNNTTGSPGDPITILRNGQSPLASSKGWIPIIEDITSDVSSIYLTYSQQLPITVGTNVRSTYTTGTAFKETDTYGGPQIALNSSRILLNANNLDGTILLNGSNTIALQAEKSVNIFAKGDIVLDGSVRLGGSTAIQPVILGTDMVKNIAQFASNIQEFTKVLENATYQVYNAKTQEYEARPLLGIQRAATQLGLYIDDFQKALPTTLSKRTYTV